jgi:nucleoside-diphosphate-sugar epimerase
MKALITGGSGYFGSLLMRKLLERGYVAGMKLKLTSFLSLSPLGDYNAVRLT